jgi:DNA-binding beta-propeller fold protein YncE
LLVLNHTADSLRTNRQPLLAARAVVPRWLPRKLQENERMWGCAKATIGLALLLALSALSAGLRMVETREEALLVVNSGENTVSFVSLPELVPTRRLATRTHPQDIVVTPDGLTAYVAEMGNDPTAEGSIADVDIASGTITRRLGLQGNHQPHLLQLSPDGKRLWAACAPQQAIVEILLTKPPKLKVWKTGQAGSYMFVVTPDQSKIYVANFDAGTISVISRNSSTNHQLVVGGKPIGIDASPDGREVWVSNFEKNEIVIVDTTSDQIVARFPADGAAPARLKFLPNGKQVIVTASRDNRAVLFDVTQRKVLRTIPLGKFPKGLLVHRDGRLAFVSEMDDGTVAQIDLASGTVLRRVRTGASPEGLAIARPARPK